MQFSLDKILNNRQDVPHQKYLVAQELDAFLGNTEREDNIFSYRKRMLADEQEEYPAKAFSLLDSWGMQAHYVPYHYGGVLSDFEQLFALIRTLARRDLTIAIGHAVSFLGSMSTWIAGAEPQKRELAEWLLNGERISLALTERAHGGDLLNMEVNVSRNKVGTLQLNGEKWLINGATYNPLLSVFVRTEPKGGPRGFSLLLFDKRTVAKSRFKILPKVKTLGIRGSNISGIQFRNAPVDPIAIIGVPGAGFEIVLKSLQLSRLLCGALALGTAENALQITLDFALNRKLYGGRVFDIPQTRRLVVEAWVDLLICDCLATAAMRSLHTVPQEASVHSAVIKYFVPVVLEEATKNLSIVLGARYYLRQEQTFGMFQKIVRDNTIISLFDGSTLVNLYSLILELKQLAYGNKKQDEKYSHAPILNVCDLSYSQRDFEWDSLALVSGGQNIFVDGLQEIIARLSDDKNANDRNLKMIKQYAQEFLLLALEIKNDMKDIEAKRAHEVPSSYFAQAKAFCVIEAGAAVLQMWLSNRQKLGSHFCRTEWIIIALARLHAMLGNHVIVPDIIYKEAGEAMVDSHRTSVTLGMVSLPRAI